MGKPKKKPTTLMRYVVYVGRGKYRIQPSGLPAKNDEYSSWTLLPRWAKDWFQYERCHLTSLDGTNVIENERERAREYEKIREYEDDCDGSIGFRVSSNRQEPIRFRRSVLHGFPPWMQALAYMPVEKLEREVNRIIATGEYYE